MGAEAFNLGQYARQEIDRGINLDNAELNELVERLQSQTNGDKESLERELTIRTTPFIEHEIKKFLASPLARTIMANNRLTEDDAKAELTSGAYAAMLKCYNKWDPPAVRIQKGQSPANFLPFLGAELGWLFKYWRRHFLKNKRKGTVAGFHIGDSYDKDGEYDSGVTPPSRDLKRMSIDVLGKLNDTHAPHSDGNEDLETGIYIGEVIRNYVNSDYYNKKPKAALKNLLVLIWRYRLEDKYIHEIRQRAEDMGAADLVQLIDTVDISNVDDKDNLKFLAKVFNCTEQNIFDIEKRTRAKLKDLS